MTAKDNSEALNEKQFKEIAKQLRQPHGESAREIGEIMNKGNLQMNLQTVRALKVDPHDDILEIGMGNGYFVKNILSVDESVKYTGCDFSEAMVDAACTTNDYYIKNEQAIFLIANANKLPFEDDSFNKVFTINTIYFWEDPQSVLKEIRRVLQPTGQLIITIRSKSVMDKFPFTKFGFKTYSEIELKELLINNGFKILQVELIAEEDFEFFGEKLKNDFLIVTAINP